MDTNNNRYLHYSITFLIISGTTWFLLLSCLREQGSLLCCRSCLLQRADVVPLVCEDVLKGDIAKAWICFQSDLRLCQDITLLVWFVLSFLMFLNISTFIIGIWYFTLYIRYLCRL